jgi:hypothetical protein
MTSVTRYAGEDLTHTLWENYPGLAEGLFQGIPAIVRVFPFLADVKLPFPFGLLSFAAALRVHPRKTLVV